MDFKEQLKASVSIVRVVGDYMALRRASPGRYTGLCPFHKEKTSSFSVSEDKGFYYCFGCKATGDVFKFVEQIQGVTFFEAMKLLAEQHGIPMPKRRDLTDAQTELRGALQQMHDLAGAYFRQQLASPGAESAREYLRKRGLTKRAVEEFGIGYSDATGNTLLKKLQQAGFSLEQIEKSSLVRQREGGGHYDYFRNRLMFPIHNETGKLIAFGGRAIGEDQPKYLNSSETELYSKKKVLYNLHRAKLATRQSDFTVIVEGYMDVIGVTMAGIGNVVAPCGTALGNEQIKVIRRHSDKVVVNFDPDNAGATATEKSIQVLLDEEMHIRVLALEGGLDPDEFVKANGAELYRKRLEEAPRYFFWLADRARTRFDDGTAEGRMEGFREVLEPAINRIPDRLERLAVANEIAAYLGVDAATIRERFRKQEAVKRVEKPPANPLAMISDSERTLLKGIFDDAALRQVVLEWLKPHPVLESLPTRGLFRAMIALSEGGGPWGFSEMEARLGENDRALLAALILADKGSERETESFSAEQATACLAALDQVWRKQEMLRLDAQIKQAERERDLTLAMKLMQERKTLERGRWSGAGTGS
ncbi:MAG: DNA primase [Bryobacteraceae bacterium]|nr:DNA primase [Bryobacteraceae bacterium]